MKKFLYLATALLAIAACTREQVAPDEPMPEPVPEPAEKQVSVTLVAGSPETRTELGTKNDQPYPLWSAGDNIWVLPVRVDEVPRDQYGNAVYPATLFEGGLTSASQSASFTGDIDVNRTYVAFYPNREVWDQENGVYTGGVYLGYDDGGDDYDPYPFLSFSIPTEQYPSQNSFDKAADFLVSNPFSVDNTDVDSEGKATVSVSFTRVNAIVKVVLHDKTTKGLLDGQVVKRVILGDYQEMEGGEAIDYAPAPLAKTRADYSGPEDAECYGLAGSVWANIGEEGECDYEFWGEGGIAAIYTDDTEYAFDNKEHTTYFITMPCVVENSVYGDDVDGLRIRVETDGMIINRNVILPDAGIALQPSRMTTLNISLYDDGVKETTIMENGFSFMHWDEEEETTVNFSSLSVKEDTYEDFWVSLVGLTLDRYEWENELQVSCEPSGYVRVNLDDVYYDYYSNELYNLEVWGEKVTDSPVTVTFSARGISSSFDVNVVKANTPASISLGDGVTRIDLDQYDALSLNATITPDDPNEPLDVNFDNFACKLIDSNGSESLISGAAFEESGSDPSEMVITLPAISEAGEFNLEITYKEASLLTIPFKVWAGADLPEALQNWKGPSRNDYLSLYYYDPVLSWFEEYRNQYNQLKTYKASQLTELLHYAFAGAFKSSDKPGNFDAFQYFTGITEISEMAFGDCTYMQGITLPDNIESIGANAFGYCRSLESIVLPDGLATIGEDAFASCSSLSSIVFPRSVTLIDDGAFQSTGLSSVTFSEGIALTTLHFNVFRETPNLKSIDLPSTLTLIESFAFYSSALESIIIPDGVSTIERYAFSDTHLTTVTIPASVTTIEEYAFSGCAMTSAFLLPEVPPTTVGNQAFEPKVLYDEDGQPYQNKYPIYVSDGSYEAYRTAAANWMASGPYNNIVDRIKKMSEVPAQ